MTKLLERAFSAANALPEHDQDFLAEMVLREMKGDKKWDAAFADPRSAQLLEQWADEALDEERERRLELWQGAQKQEQPMLLAAAKRLGEDLQQLVARVEAGEAVATPQLFLTRAATDTFSHLLAVYGYLLMQEGRENKKPETEG